MAEAGEEAEEELEFKWGKPRGVGVKNKNVRFYESFTYDGEDYTLYDSVFLFKEGEPEPYVGKLIKIWEGADKTKKVRVLWYFRPCEIHNFLDGYQTLQNELFLASGEGLGLSNINPLEAITGKCNVVCISKDNRNPLPSAEELQMADFVFSRCFDVGKCEISDKIGDKIAGVEVKNIFNNLDRQKLVGHVKVGLDEKEVRGNLMATNEAVALSGEENSKPLIEKPGGKGFDTLVRDSSYSKPPLGGKPTSSFGLKKSSKSNALNTSSGDKTFPQAKENGTHRASLVKQKSSTKLSLGSKDASKMRESPRIGGDVSTGKTTMRSKVDFEKDEREVDGVIEGKISKGLVGDKAFEKGKYVGLSKAYSTKIKTNVQNRRAHDDDDDVKCVAPSSSKDKYKLQREKDFCDVEEVPSKKLKVDMKPTKVSGDMPRKESSTIPQSVDHKLDCGVTEVTRRLDVDRSKWFKGMSWEERMKNAYEQRRVVLLENLDPSLTSSEVKDIISHGFKESCTAQMIPKTTYSSPHSGQALVIFQRKETAELVIRKLEDGCFLMSNGRPLVGRIALSCFPEKKPTFYGHLAIDHLRLQMQREMKDAVSTSHCSQANNIEYDMAIEWCLLQERADKAWKMLYQQQGEELSKLKAKLKAEV